MRHAKSTDNGATWTETTEPVSGASSLGGFGRSFNADWLPPGDFIACDADNEFVYIAWPDSRAYIGGNNKPQVFFRRLVN